MRSRAWSVATSLAIVLIAGWQGLPAQQGESGWIEEEPGGETGCAFGSPYRFFHNALDRSSDLLIYFQGGGACWDWVSCAGLFDTSVTPDELHEYGGVFDRENPTNPFREFAMVFVSYCTGDVHVGDVDQRYDPTGPSVAHRGYRNVKAVLDWLEGRVDPERIVVAGASAGSYGALFYTPDIARRFPEAAIVMLGDSGLPLLHDYPKILRDWGAESVLAKIRRTEMSQGAVSLSLSEAHAEASVNGRVRLAQITSDRDAIQSAFYLISGSADWRERVYGLLADIAVRVPSFRYYVVSGSDHGLLRADRFYGYRSSDIRLRDWVADLIRGADVENVRCAACGPA